MKKRRSFIQKLSESDRNAWKTIATTSAKFSPPSYTLSYHIFIDISLFYLFILCHVSLFYTSPFPSNHDLFILFSLSFNFNKTYLNLHLFPELSYFASKTQRAPPFIVHVLSIVPGCSSPRSMSFVCILPEQKNAGQATVHDTAMKHRDTVARAEILDTIVPTCKSTRPNGELLPIIMSLSIRTMFQNAHNLNSKISFTYIYF